MFEIICAQCGSLMQEGHACNCLPIKQGHATRTTAINTETIDSLKAQLAERETHMLLVEQTYEANRRVIDKLQSDLDEAVKALEKCTTEYICMCYRNDEPQSTRNPCIHCRRKTEALQTLERIKTKKAESEWISKD